MAFFSAADVADFADLVEEASPDTAIIRRLETESDGHGGQVETWEDVATVDVKVSILGATTPTEQIVAQESVGRVTMLLTFPAGTDVTVNDTVQVVTVDGPDDVYDISGVIPVRSFDVRRRVIGVLVS